jgi:hypothetical protein
VVERQLPKLDVAGSIPVSRSIFSMTSVAGLVRRYLVEMKKYPLPTVSSDRHHLIGACRRSTDP